MRKYKTKAERDKIIDKFIQECIKEGSVPNITELKNSNDPEERYLGHLIHQVGKRNICNEYNLESTVKHNIKDINKVLDKFAKECRENNKMPTNRELLSNKKGKQIYHFILKVHKSKVNFAKHYKIERLYDETNKRRDGLNKLTKKEKYQEHKKIINKELKIINRKVILTREDFNRVKVEDKLGKFRVLKYIQEEDITYMPRSAYKLIKELDDNKHKEFETLKEIYNDKRNYTPKMFFYQRYKIINLRELLDFLEISY